MKNKSLITASQPWWKKEVTFQHVQTLSNLTNLFIKICKAILQEAPFTFHISVTNTTCNISPRNYVPTNMMRTLSYLCSPIGVFQGMYLNGLHILNEMSIRSIFKGLVGIKLVLPWNKLIDTSYMIEKFFQFTF